MRVMLDMWTRATKRLRIVAARTYSRSSVWPYSSRSLLLHRLCARRHFNSAGSVLRATTGLSAPSGSKFTVERSTTIPKLAWLARQDALGWRFTLGDAVELLSGGFYEGVWDGDYGSTSPAESDAAFGSGMLPGPGASVTFLNPRHPYEHTWVLQNEDVTLVSNSLIFVLEAGGISEDGKLLEVLHQTLVQQTYREGRRGVDRARLLAARGDGWRLYRMVFFDYVIDEHGRVSRIWRDPVRPPSTFSDYAKFLEATVTRLASNGLASERMSKLDPIAAVSRGYDSTAVAALLRHQESVRLLTLDVKVGGRDDGGQEIAAALRKPIVAYQHVIADDVPNLRFDFTGSLASEIIEFIATAGVGDDVTFRPFEPALGSTLLMTGVYGDEIWSTRKRLNPGLAESTRFGKSLTEFRLRVGFAHVPVPVLGARFNKPIKRLSTGRDMRPWSLGGDYDRPIPRRIAEEAGVPRNVFGQEKRATAPLATNHDDLFPTAVRLVRERYRNTSEAQADAV